MLDRSLLRALAIASLAAVAAVPLACGSSGGNGATGDDGGTGDDGSVTNDDGGNTQVDGGNTGDGAPTCAAVQAACSANGDCCSHLCLGNQCVPSISTCGQAGAVCGVSTDCCNGNCVNGFCGSAQCVSIGQACPAAGNTCCTDTCANGKCAAIGTLPDGGTSGGGCTTSGNTCAHDSDCCSGLCSNGKCNKASSFCLQNGEMCFLSADCCGGTCAAPNGKPVSATNPGLCSSPSGAVNCTAVDGIVCAGTPAGCPGPCCSDLCAPFGPTGVLICQPAQGCRVEGDLCEKNTDCCGGEADVDGGLPGASLVVCTIQPGAKIGVCSTPSAANGGGNTCAPAGDVCHYNGTDYNCSVSGSRSDCCDVDGHPNKALCQLDKLGVPRCLVFDGDGGANACRQTGQTCATANDCCNGVPCVPGPGGALVCATTSCIPSSGPCTSNADCCAGITCVIPVGSPSGTCAAVPPPPTGDGGTSGGTDGGSSGTDSGTGLGCATFGQSCASLPCCTGYVCNAGTCGLVH